MSNARDHAADLLLAFDKGGGFVREPLAQRRTQLTDPRERALLTELVYGSIRQRATLDAILARYTRRPLAALHTAVRGALRIGLYQVLFLDRVPAHAAVDHAVGWARHRGGAKRAGFVNGVLRGVLRGIAGRATGPTKPRRDVPRADGTCVRFRRDVFADPARTEAVHLGQRWSMPTWLVERWIKQFGTPDTIAYLRAGVQRPGLAVRAREDVERLTARLAARGIVAAPGPVPGSLLLAGGDSEILEEVEAGRAAIQDPTSQRVAPLCGEQAGGHVLDLCAAPGGKTLHLADRMRTGTITAADVDASKLEALERLASRMGEVVLETRRVAPEGPLPFAPATYDAVLVDAPCSNTGVLARRVEARWRLMPKDILSLAALQRGLVERSLPLVKPGGRLVYSTCSLEGEENEALCKALGTAHPEWHIETAFRTFPDGQQDGGFAAVFTR